MHDSVITAKHSLIVTITAMTVSSISLSLIPFTSGIKEGQNNILPYVIAAVFWLGLIVAIISTHMIKLRLYRWRSRLVTRAQFKKQQIPGIFYFSLNMRNIVIYSITVIGLIFIIADIIFTFIPPIIMFPIISITLLSFMLHCVFDGQYYKVYKIIKESMDDETKH